jgi:hypothetical protein
MYAVSSRVFGSIKSLVGFVDQFFWQVIAEVFCNSKTASDRDWTGTGEDRSFRDGEAKILGPFQCVGQ